MTATALLLSLALSILMPFPNCRLSRRLRFPHRPGPVRCGKGGSSGGILLGGAAAAQPPAMPSSPACRRARRSAVQRVRASSAGAPPGARSALRRILNPR